MDLLGGRISIKLRPDKQTIEPGPKIPPTSGRKTKPDIKNTYTDIIKGVKFVNMGFLRSVIPVIRALSWINPDLGLAVNDMVRLTNTGHKITFDQEIPEKERDEMRRLLKERRKLWGDGVHGINGLVNKQIAQIFISGALSCEWVVDRSKKYIENMVLVNPETIYCSYNTIRRRFDFYQKQDGIKVNDLATKYVKLNPITFKYFAINGDTEIPYGIPPYLTSLNNIQVGANMDKNIDFIIEQLGLLGFFEALVQKPSMNDGENVEKYKARLNTYLDEVKKSLKNGMKDGMVVGYTDDHEFNFHSPTKNVSGTSDLYKQNQIKIASGLKTPPEFIGFPTGNSESAMSIIFSKMLSQLSTVQEMIAENLAYGYMLELKLAGYSKVGLTVEFRPSTITDELKSQQSLEYKIRNVDNKYQMGVIDQQQKAEELGYDKPAEKEPRGPIDSSGKDKQTREADKDTSDRKVRDKNKPVPKRKDNDTKPR